jgi:hypothetical protein
MAGVAYKDVVPVLLERFPDFVESDYYDPEDLDLSYLMWGNFARYAMHYLRRQPAERLDDDPFVERVFALANDLMDSHDPDTNTIVTIELFENFYMYRKTLELARRKLKPEHREWLEKQGAMFGTSELHYDGELIAPQGLEPLTDLFHGCSWTIRVRQQGLGGRPCIEGIDNRIELTMVPGDGPRYAFFGDCHHICDQDLAHRLLDELSGCLARGDIAHRIRLIRTGIKDEPLAYFHHRWPDGQDRGSDSCRTVET